MCAIEWRDLQEITSGRADPAALSRNTHHENEMVKLSLVFMAVCENVDILSPQYDTVQLTYGNHKTKGKSKL